MRLTADESKALGFIALLLALSAAARVIDRPEPIEADLAEVDAGALGQASRNAREDASRSAQPLAKGETIDPNHAEAEELMRLPRVGRALADRIIADRGANGPYRSLADLDRVSGIGPATIEAWAAHIALPRAARRGAPGVSAQTPAGSGAGGSAASGRAAGVSNTRVRASARVGASGAGPVDVNHATAEELETVPGIGPALAGRIIAHRQAIGRFTRLEQLVEVAGIGEATLRRIGPYLRVGS